jgi:ribose transport system ATP-binding protein
VIRKLRAAGLGVIYISHFLEELRAVCDRCTVLRDGQVVATAQLADISQADLVALMVGRDVDELFPHTPHVPGDVVLSLACLSGRRVPRDVSLELRRGEILGIAGLVGAGRTELLRTIFGLDPVRSGYVRVAGATRRATPRAMIDAGLGFVSEDRKGEALAQNLSIEENATASRLQPYSRWGWLDLRRRRAAAEEWMRQLSVKAASPAQAVATLSGGNQQKVALARVLHQQADVLLLDEPTRGIDVGTKAEIYRLMGQAAAEGKAIVFVSSYLPELLAMCDRIGVMSRGRLRAIRPVAEWTAESILACAVANETAA